MEAPANLRKLIVIREYRAALARVQILARLKTKTAGRPPRTNFSPPPFGQMRLAGIFDDRNLMLLCHFKNLVQIHARTAQVDWDDRPGAFGNCSFDLVRI